VRSGGIRGRRQPLLVAGGVRGSDFGPPASSLDRRFGFGAPTSGAYPPFCEQGISGEQAVMDRPMKKKRTVASQAAAWAIA
ncbi:hypothetical protein ACGY7B_24355, partial [Burkholderia pseudomallei]